MSSGLWALAGVVVGGLTSGVVRHYIQQRQFDHEVEMHKMKNRGIENVKSLLTEMLSHKSFTDRSFEAMRKRVGGYSDAEVQQFLHEVGAKKTSRNKGAEEWWYLASREEERIAKRDAASD